MPNEPREQLVKKIPEWIVADLRRMRHAAPSTWACTSRFAELVDPYIKKREATDAVVLTEIISQMDSREAKCPEQC